MEAMTDFNPHMSCPHLLRASMITAVAIMVPPVVMDCRDEPGNDIGGF
jgi:hypothetical protein